MGLSSNVTGVLEAGKRREGRMPVTRSQGQKRRQPRTLPEGRGEDGFPSAGLRGSRASIAITLILDFSPPELEKNTLLLLAPPGYSSDRERNSRRSAPLLPTPIPHPQASRSFRHRSLGERDPQLRGCLTGLQTQPLPPWSLEEGAGHVS